MDSLGASYGRSDAFNIVSVTLASAAGVAIPTIITIATSMKVEWSWTFLIPLAVFVLALFIQQRNPMRWWVPFRGTYMKVNLNRIIAREQSGESSDAIQAEISAWVRDSMGWRAYQQNPYKFKFLRKSDAVLFKLAWG